jgi:hypothetical protein
VGRRVAPREAPKDEHQERRWVIRATERRFTVRLGEMRPRMVV